jgi:hypothetical protein
MTVSAPAGADWLKAHDEGMRGAIKAHQAAAEWTRRAGPVNATTPRWR